MALVLHRSAFYSIFILRMFLLSFMVFERNVLEKQILNVHKSTKLKCYDFHPFYLMDVFGLFSE